LRSRRLKSSDLAASLKDMPDPRERLLRRVETEARAFANSDSSFSQLRLGRIYGLLEAGVIAGHWRRRDSDAAGELIRHRYRVSKLRDVLLRGDSVTLWRVTDIADFLGVSHQRVDQLVGQGRMPGPSVRSGRVRLWERSAIEEWAEAEWWDSRRWRHRS
jgi:excisionase family DNA binding protein